MLYTMRSFTTDLGTTFLYNSDCTGDVLIQAVNGAELTIPGHDLLAFVADIVRQERIAALEAMDSATLLGMA